MRAASDATEVDVIDQRVAATATVAGPDDARRQAEDDLDRFFAASPDLLLIPDREGRFVRHNPAWTAELGYSDQELERMTLLDLTHPDDMELTVAAGNDMLGDGQ